MRFSPSTGCFYPDQLVYSSPPKDLIPVTQEDFETCMAAPTGSTFSANNGAMVIIPPPPIEQPAK